MQILTVIIPLVEELSEEEMLNITEELKRFVPRDTICSWLNVDTNGIDPNHITIQAKRKQESPCGRHYRALRKAIDDKLASRPTANHVQLIIEQLEDQNVLNAVEFFGRVTLTRTDQAFLRTRNAEWLPKICKLLLINT